MKSSKQILLLAVLLTAGAQAAEPAAEGFKLKASVQLHGEKRLWDESTDRLDTLIDNSYVRANFGAVYKAEDVSADFNLRFWGATYGNTVIDKYDKATGTVSATKAVDNVMLEKAIVELKLPSGLKMKAGRWATDLSMMSHFGNYLDLDPTAKKIFLSRPFYHDGVEFSHKEGMFQSSLLIGASDKYLNTGYVRFLETVTVPQIKMTVAAGYRANILDSLSTPENETRIHHRLYARVQDSLPMGFVPYVEGALLDIVDNGVLKEEMMGVVNFGVIIPTPSKATQVALEAEVEKDRIIKMGDKEYKRPIDWNLAITQKMGKRAKLQFYTFSDPSAAHVYDVEMGARLTLAVE